MCFSRVKDEHFARDHEQCLTLKTTPNIILPEEGDTYKFKQLQALHKPCSYGEISLG